jgi:hypothetical protein
MKASIAFTLGILVSVCISFCLGFTTSTNNLNITQYKIIEAENRVQELERNVQSEINSGWTPQGGLVVSELSRGGETIVYLHQAMVK